MKKLDSIALTSIAAQRAGMTYGKYKGMLYAQKQAKEAKEKRLTNKPKKVFNPNPKIPVKVCAFCGKEFPTAGRSANCKYCSWECANMANNVRAREYMRKKYALKEQSR